MDSVSLMQVQRRSALRAAAWVAVVVPFLIIQFVFFGCSRQKSDRIKRMSWETGRSSAPARDSVVPAVADEEVLDLVRESPAPDGVGLMSEWVTRGVNASDQLLFPRWQVARRGATRYEVKYTYTLINVTNQLSRQGYSWNVDAALKLVGPPVALVLNEPLPAQARSFSQQQRRRIQDEEASLE